MTGHLLTPAAVAERCEVSTKTVMRAIHAGRLRASRLGAGGALRIREEDFEAWIEQSVLEPTPPARVPALLPRAPSRGRLTLTSEMGRR